MTSTVRSAAYSFGRLVTVTLTAARKAAYSLTEPLTVLAVAIRTSQVNKPLPGALSTLMGARANQVGKPLSATVLLTALATRLNGLLRAATVTLTAKRAVALAWTKQATVNLVTNLQRFLSLFKLVTVTFTAVRAVAIFYIKQAIVLLGTFKMITFLRTLSASVVVVGFGIVARIKILLATVSASNNYFIIAHTGGGGGGGPQTHNYMRVALVNSVATRVTGQSLSQLLLAVITSTAQRAWLVGFTRSAAVLSAGSRINMLGVTRSTVVSLQSTTIRAILMVKTVSVFLSASTSKLFSLLKAALVSLFAQLTTGQRIKVATWDRGVAETKWSLTMATTRISTLSLQKVRVQVTSTINPTTDTVQMAVTPTGTTSPTFFTAAWETVGSTNWAAILVGPTSTVGTLTVGVYDVWVKVTDNPEVPVLQAQAGLTVY